MLLACVSVLSISRCERNMLRSPFSMYSVTMHSGSDDTHTHSSRMMFGSFRRDMILISFRKSFLTDRWRQRFGEMLFLITQMDKKLIIFSSKNLINLHLYKAGLL